MDADGSVFPHRDTGVAPVPGLSLGRERLAIDDAKQVQQRHSFVQGGVAKQLEDLSQTLGLKEVRIHEALGIPLVSMHQSHVQTLKQLDAVGKVGDLVKQTRGHRLVVDQSRLFQDRRWLFGRQQFSYNGVDPFVLALAKYPQSRIGQLKSTLTQSDTSP